MLFLLMAACTIQEDLPDGAADNVAIDNNDPGCAIFAMPHLDFGQVALGAPAVLELNIRNDCAGQLELSHLAVTPNSGFTASLLGPPVLAQGQKTRVSVGFAPWSGDTYVGELWVEGGSVAFTERLPLAGAGQAPRVVADRDTVSFTDVTPGCSDAATIGVRNDGYADLTLLGAEVVGDGFAVDGLSDPVVLAPGSSFPLSVTWSSASFDVPNGQLIVLTDDPFEPELKIALSGTIKAGSQRSDLFEANPRAIDLVIAAQGAVIEAGLDAAITSIVSEFDTYGVRWRGYVVTVAPNGATYTKRSWRTRASDLTADTSALDPSTAQAAWLAYVLAGFAIAEKPGHNNALVATFFGVDRDQWMVTYLTEYESSLSDVRYGAIAASTACGDLAAASELRKAIRVKDGTLIDACDADWGPDVTKAALAFVGEAVGFELAHPALDGLTATVNGEAASADLLPDGRTAIVADALPGSDVIISYVPAPISCP